MKKNPKRIHIIRLSHTIPFKEDDDNDTKRKVFRYTWPCMHP